ncbi:hypothetical protein LR48_Vigan118s002400 [Vigna angularis]|uniref:Uncharacterized protein n=1 Tax=Phaseolus angularis TaxID=3914 RepID=A0A0L9T639_PHAAN|nr:hypothetical protein LR48_Vigan118s002400 [Vigna angularis]
MLNCICPLVETTGSRTPLSAINCRHAAPSPTSAPSIRHAQLPPSRTTLITILARVSRRTTTINHHHRSSSPSAGTPSMKPRHCTFLLREFFTPSPSFPPLALCHYSTAVAMAATILQSSHDLLPWPIIISDLQIQKPRKPNRATIYLLRRAPPSTSRYRAAAETPCPSRHQQTVRSSFSIFVSFITTESISSSITCKVNTENQRQPLTQPSTSSIRETPPSRELPRMAVFSINQRRRRAATIILAHQQKSLHGAGTGASPFPKSEP